MAIVSAYKKSIHEIGLDPEKESIIWDFYVTRSFASSASQKRSVKDFGISRIPLKEMFAAAGVAEGDAIIIPCTTMPGTLQKLALETTAKDESKNTIELDIDVDRPRLCCIQKFSVTDEKGITAQGSPAECLLTHIRNAFAHGNTFFFDNGNVLLEDKDSNKITARILISVQTLIDWIVIIDKIGSVYPCLQEEKRISD